MVAVAQCRKLDHLIQGADFHSPATRWRRFVADAGKGTILVEAALCSPIGIVEVIEDLIPPHECPSWLRGQAACRSKELSESQAQVVAGLNKPLLEARPKSELPILTAL